jgi:hypothetical protein
LDLYRKLWSRVGGRPWTYIIRDFWHKYEGLCIVALVAVGVFLGRWYSDQLLMLLAAFTCGYITGHLFWGTEYKPGQKGND